MLTLLGIGVIVLGFAARQNPLLVIAAAALVTGWAAGFDVVHTLSAFGKAFNDNRYVSVVFIVLPVIGLLERAGLQERARLAFADLKGFTAGRLLLSYFLLRQICAALGIPIGGHVQVVRPLLAPMAEAAAENVHAPLGNAMRYRIRALAAASENIGVFFGEDIFIAFGSVLLIRAFLVANGITLQPLQLSLWAIPTALLASAIHGTRLIRLDRTLAEPKESGDSA